MVLPVDEVFIEIFYRIIVLFYLEIAVWFVNYTRRFGSSNVNNSLEYYFGILADVVLNGIY